MLTLILGILIAVLLPIFTSYFLKEEVPDWNPKKKTQFKVLIGFLCVLSISMGILASIIVIVPAGTVGVHDMLGVVSDEELHAGARLKNPLAHVEIMSIKTHEIKERSEVPSREGLIVRLDVSILFRIDYEKADIIYRTIGVRYWDVVLKPQLRSVIREVTASYEAKALYTTGRINITIDIFNGLKPKLMERGIILERVLLRDLGLPATLLNAIEQKLTAEQQIEQKQFEVRVAEEEKKKRVVDAKGVADAMAIINEQLTPEYLQHEAIITMEKLVNSPNTVFYFLPMSNEGMGMPLVLNKPLGPVG